MAFQFFAAPGLRVNTAALFASAFALVWWSGIASADEVSVAVASNFIGPLKRMAADFQQKSGHTLLMSSASTGKLYAQIKSGAPFDVLLSADAETPGRLEDEGAAVLGTRFTYAYGKLVLWSSRPSYVDDQGDVLKRADYRHLALPNPKLSPYGRAAVETLLHLKLLDWVQPRLVVGESVSQSFQFVASRNADLGFIAMSQIIVDGQLRPNVWVVPPAYYKPLRQDAVMLKHGRDNPAAEAFLRFLKTAPVRAVIKSYGYNLTETQ